MIGGQFVTNRSRKIFSDESEVNPIVQIKKVRFLTLLFKGGSISFGDSKGNRSPECCEVLSVLTGHLFLFPEPKISLYEWSSFAVQYSWTSPKTNWVPSCANVSPVADLAISRCNREKPKRGRAMSMTLKRVSTGKWSSTMLEWSSNQSTRQLSC